MPAAPGIIDLGKFRVAYEEERKRAAEGTDAYFLQQRALIRLNKDLVKIERAPRSHRSVRRSELQKRDGESSLAAAVFHRFHRLLHVQPDDTFRRALGSAAAGCEMELRMTYDLRIKLRLNDLATAAQALTYRSNIESPAPLERIIASLN